MMKTLILFILLISNVHAQEESECVEVKTFADELRSSIEGPKCPTANDLIMNMVTKEYQQFYGNQPKSRLKVKGVVLSGSEKELRIADEMLGNKVTSHWKKAALGCETVLCAFEKLFNSKEAAMQVFNFKAKTGYTISLDQTINNDLKDQIWSAKEIRELEAAASKLPPELRNLQRLKSIYRTANGLRRPIDSDNVAAYASPGGSYSGAKVVFYENGLHGLSEKNAYEGSSWPQEAFIHEICHHHDFKGYYNTNFENMLSEQKNSAFGSLSGWKEKVNSKGETVWTKSPKATFVSDYSETSPAEDYAESCMNFILHPNKLKKDSPQKYAYMKERVFNNKEFQNEIWNKSKSGDWPKLQSLIADESNCHAKIIECSGKINQYSWITLKSQISSGDCFRSFKNQRRRDITEQLADDPNFCEKGGKDSINDSSSEICRHSVSSFNKFVNEIYEFNFQSIATACESQRDYTEECVLNMAKEKLKYSKELDPLLDQLISFKIPDRLAPLEKDIEKINLSTLVKTCFDLTKNIVQNKFLFADGSTQNLYAFEPKSDEFKSAYLGKYISQYSNERDMNMLCGQQVLKQLENDGIKTPSKTNAAILLKKGLGSELESFENEVLDQLKTATKGCILSGCKNKRIFELLKNWEAKSANRAGLATEEFAKEIRKKVTVYE